MKAEIIAVGTEILLGETVDTNGSWIARQLPSLGIDLLHKSVVGDNPARLAEVFQRAWHRSDLTIVTGGLGPTADDLTREAVAALLGEEPAVDPELEAHLRALFSRRGNRMPEQNVKQAWLIPSARALPNPRGTAPGWWVEKDGRIIVCLPGVPTEMEHMWTREVRPALSALNSGKRLILRTVKTVGLGESTVDETIGRLHGRPGIGIGTYARGDGVHIRIGAKGKTEEAAWALIEPIERELESLLGEAIWGRDEDRFESHLAALFGERGLTLGVNEAGTGGTVTSILAGAPEASCYLRTCRVLLSPRDVEDAGVPAETLAQHGLHSEEVARALALSARRSVSADFGLGVTGLLEPAPAAAGTAPGTVYLAVCSSDGRGPAATLTMNQGRLAVQRRAATTSMMLLRRALLTPSSSA